MIVNKNLKKLIFEIGDSKKITFAAELGTSHQNLSRWCTNANFGVKSIERLKSLYPNVDLNWLFTGNGEMFITEQHTKECENHYQVSHMKKIESQLIRQTEMIKEMNDTLESLKSQIEMLKKYNKKRAKNRAKTPKKAPNKDILKNVSN